MNTNFNYTKGITHGGVFHADDVFSAAFLQLLNPDITIDRVMRVPEDIMDNTIVFDIGRGLYDHHQSDTECRSNGIKYAAFGLLWRDFGHLLVPESQVDTFDKIFVQSIDHPDNGGPVTAMYQSISSFVPNWNDEDQDMDKAFTKSTAFAKDILKREIARMNSIGRANKEVKEALNKSTGEIVILDRFVPWQDVLASSDAKFVIFPSLRGGYNAQAVPTTADGRDQKFPFPAEWAGKQGDEANALCQGMSFCHPGRFMISADTIDNAVKACDKALQAKEVK